MAVTDAVLSLALDDIAFEPIVIPRSEAEIGLEGLTEHSMTEAGASSVGPWGILCSCCCCDSCG